VASTCADLRTSRECSCERGEESSKARRAFQNRAPARHLRPWALRRALPERPEAPSRTVRRPTVPPVKGARPQPPPQARELAGPTPPTLTPLRRPTGQALQGGWIVKVLLLGPRYGPGFEPARRAAAGGWTKQVFPPPERAPLHAAEPPGLEQRRLRNAACGTAVQDSCRRAAHRAPVAATDRGGSAGGPESDAGTRPAPAVSATERHRTPHVREPHRRDPNTGLGERGGRSAR
jgi:hypothetical protein